ncbi:MAG: glycerophosphodiester phosphodiesterase family protein [Tepidisphaeraceae bacterium]
MKSSFVIATSWIAVVSSQSFATAAAYQTLSGSAPVVIGHRGATGYLPEHTLAGYELAIKLGADYIEPDLQMTKDGVLVAMHDSTLNRTTNVATVLGKRNGGYDVADYTLAEIKQLTVTVASSNTTAAASYPGFTPTSANPFKIPTFDEVLSFVKTERAAGNWVGVYPEAKESDTAMEAAIVASLKSAGLTTASDGVIIQSFGTSILQDLYNNRVTNGVDVPLMQLTSAPTSSKLASYAAYADIVGPSISSSNVNASYIALAHSLGMEVHGYTFDNANAASAIAQYDAYYAMGMDGVFSNYVDLAVEARSTLVPEPTAGVALLAVSALGLRRRRSR